jgi:DNA-binding response OmpR family regulator
VKILIVEDELPVARQIAAALTEDGHDPKTVHSGEAALEDVGKGSFDLIVLDVRLPGIDGFELLGRLREQHLASRVLLLTGRSRRSSNRLAARGRRLFTEAICHA